MFDFFSTFLTRDQRTRLETRKFDASVALSRSNSLSQHPTPLPTPPPSPQTLHPQLALQTSLISFPMTPSLSSASSTSISSRPSSSSSSPPTQRPPVRRHASIARSPINYDSLLLSNPTPPSTSPPKRSASTSSLLYPLPPLGPMQGVGRHRRSCNPNPMFVEALEKGELEALKPVIQEEERVSRLRGRDVTTPTRAFSTSPGEDGEGRQRRMQSEIERWAAEMEVVEKGEECVQPPRTCSTGDLSRRPVRQAPRRRPAPSRERSSRNVRRSTGSKPQPKKPVSAGGHYKQRPMPKEVQMSASLETLVDGEE